MKERTPLFVLRLSGENYFKWVTTDGYKKRRWSSENVIEKSKFHGVGRKKTGQLIITGKIGYLVTKVRYKLVTITLFIFGESPMKLTTPIT